MKKFLSVFLVILVAGFGLVACNNTTAEAEIALVTDVGNIDDKSFNEGAWNGVKQFAEANDVSYAYYRPSEDSDAARIESIQNAIENGAKVVVCPGYLFEVAIYEVQADYPDVRFLLLDGEPHTADYATYETLSNTHSILYQEEQAGFLAGYAAVMDGYRDLGYVGGMAVPAVVRFGYGYIQGAEYAADELGLSAGDVTVEYYYANAFVGSDALETKMDGWYSDGIEVVFACGGKLYTSVVAAAEAADAKVIGVDVDQVAESDTIITSAMKGLTVSVVDALVDLYNNSVYSADGLTRDWPEELAGVTSVLGADTDGIGLPTVETSWRFETFTVAQYEVIFDALVDGTIVVSNDIENKPTTTLVTVTYDE